MDFNSRMKFLSLFIIGAVALTVAGFYYFSMSEEMQSQKIKLEPNDINLVTAGRTVYLQNCASCHGIQLEGQKNWRRRNSEGYLPAPPHDETGHTWHHSDSYLFNMTKYGIEKIIGKKYQNNMPAYDGILSDDEIIAVLSYIKSMWPKSIREKHDQINARASSFNKRS